MSEELGVIFNVKHYGVMEIEVESNFNNEDSALEYAKKEFEKRIRRNMPKSYTYEFITKVVSSNEHDKGETIRYCKTYFIFKYELK